ncbi:unnamed protein product, partial [Scytosiphon promiscuus]
SSCVGRYRRQADLASMSYSPSLPRRKYGSTEDESSAKALAPRSNAPESTGGSRPHGRRWRNIAAVGALTLGVAVVGLAYNRQPQTTSPTEDASLVDVVSPTEPAVVKLPQAFPKVVSPAVEAVAEKGSSAPPAGPATGELSPLSFEAVNFYHLRDGKPGVAYPWLQDVKLIEPYRETTLSVSSPRDGYDYVWEVRSADPADDDELRASASGASAVVVLTVLDENMVTVKEVNSDGEVVRQLDELVIVKYVRREIRTLTDEEREELFDAMYTLWSVHVDGGNGKEIYGEDYADIYAINRLHFKAGMSNDCDHFHDGIGFLTSHSLISNTFEFSLQTVNPKLSLPYWDWTIDEIDAQNSGVTNSGTGTGIVIDSPIFTPEWFGSTDPDDHLVKDGRWANTKIPAMYWDDPGDLIPDVYGLLRSRWNVNSSPWLTRGNGAMCDGYVTDHYDWPTCEEHYNLVTKYSSFYDWVWTSMYSPHGPVHTWIGGVLNCEETIRSVGSLIGVDNAYSLALSAFDNRKDFWFEGYFKCEGTGGNLGETAAMLFASGQCGCLGYDLTQGDDWKTIYYNSSLDFDAVISDFDDITKRDTVAAVCASTIFDGDHLQAGSSLDPTFWPMHPTMERMFMFSTLTGKTSDMSWPDDSEDPSIKWLSKYGDECTGHRGFDVFPFGFLDTDIDGFEVKTGIKGNGKTGNSMTNQEVLLAMDPRLNNLNYVYDTFTWDHCLDAGIDFDNAWD